MWDDVIEEYKAVREAEGNVLSLYVFAWMDSMERHGRNDDHRKSCFRCGE